MLTREEVQSITRVGSGTPMGDMLRRYWIPALLSEELPERDGAPKAIRLLGEDLVAFRDTHGRVGVMDLHCPHRGPSLALGRNEEGGLRCLYHGWKIDVSGNILDTPCEPPESRLKDAVVHTAYEAREAAELVWVYMGPAGKAPTFPNFSWMTVPSTHRAVGKMVEDCNFIQGLEGVLDSFHSNVLHSGYEIMHWSKEDIAERWKRPSRAAFGRIGAEPTEYGFHYAAIREPTHDADKYDYVRIAEFTAPFYCSPPMDLGLSSRPLIFVPMDDDHTMLYQVQASESQVRQYSGFAYSNVASRNPVTGEFSKEAFLAQNKLRVGIDLDEQYRPLVNQGNNYAQDRGAMGAKDLDVWYSFTGISGGAQCQDRAMVETMGPIADREKEHLGASDQAIVRWREYLVDTVRAFVNGAEPPAVAPSTPYPDIKSSGALIPKGADWRLGTWQAQKERAASPDAALSS
jgi:phthalate 4,5-dioxygenase